MSEVGDSLEYKYLNFSVQNNKSDRIEEREEKTIEQESNAIVFYIPSKIWRHYLEVFGIEATTVEEIYQKIMEKIGETAFLDFITKASEHRSDYRISDIRRRFRVPAVFSSILLDFTKRAKDKVVGKQVFFKSKEDWIYGLCHKLAEHNRKIGKSGAEKWLITHLVFKYGLRFEKIAPIINDLYKYKIKQREIRIIQQSFLDFNQKIADKINKLGIAMKEIRVFVPYETLGIVCNVCGVSDYYQRGRYNIHENIVPSYFVTYTISKSIVEHDELIEKEISKIDERIIDDMEEIVITFEEEHEKLIENVKSVKEDVEFDYLTWKELNKASRPDEALDILYDELKDINEEFAKIIRDALWEYRNEEKIMDKIKMELRKRGYKDKKISFYIKMLSPIVRSALDVIKRKEDDVHRQAVELIRRGAKIEIPEDALVE